MVFHPLAKRAPARLALVAAVSIAAVASAFVAGCGGSDTEDPSDAAATPDAPGPDGTVVRDASADRSAPDADSAAPADATVEAAIDSGPDAAIDAGVDAPIDARIDTGVDAGLDAGVDASVDAGVDAHLDAALDAGVDAALDAGVDAAVDASVDAGIDATVAPNPLGAAKGFVVLGGAAVTITGVTTTLVGDVGSSPGTNIASFPAGQPVGVIHAGDVTAALAQADLTIAYNTLAGKPCIPANDRSGVDLGGKTLAPGTYCFNSSAGITGDLVLDAQGNPNAEWVFQVASTLTTATVSSVSVINGGSACNVYWQIGSSATLGTGTVFKGNIVALASITLVTGASIVPGRALARNGLVALDSNALSKAGCP